MSRAYDVFVNDPPPQDGLLPDGEPRRFSPTTTAARSPATSATSSTNAAPSPRSWSVTTGADPSPGPPR